MHMSRVFSCLVSVGCSWEAVFVVVDKKPFPEMYTIIENMNETRAWVFAEWVRVLMCVALL